MTRKAGIVGKANEVPVVIQDVDTVALIDSGSQVSTIAESFVLSNFPEKEITSVEAFLDIEDAGGNRLAYSGVVDLDFHAKAGSEDRICTPFLVVKDTRYNRFTPVVVGTNIIDCLFDGKDSSDGVEGPWLTACKIAQSRRSAIGSNGHVGVVHSLKQIVIPPNSQATVHGATRAGPIGHVLALTEEGDYGTLPGGLVLLPSVSSLDSQSKTSTRVSVRLHNLSGKSVTIPPKTQLCELRQVELVVPSLNKNAENDFTNCDNSGTDGHGPPTVSHQATCDGPVDFLSQFKLEESDLTGDERGQVEELLLRWKHIFAQSDFDLGNTDTVEHRIRLHDDCPVKERYRSIPPSLQEEVRKHLHETLDCGVIRPSCSPFAAPVVLVRKKDKSLRFCIDFRRLNARTVKDAQTLPRIEDTLHSLAGAKCFSTLDLKAGYWQVRVSEQDRHKTAFTVGPLGFYEFNRLPFGLTNAPATFQRLMETAMGDLYLTQCLLYLDDVVVYSRDFAEHLVRLENVFKRLEAHNLKLKPSKCTLFQKQVKYLGHVISKDGIATDPDKISAVKDWPVPTNLKELRRFLGFSGFYRRFVQGYSKIARPLYDLLKGNSPKQKKKATGSFVWQESHQQAFNQLVESLASAPVLGFADFSKPFILHTDASADGLGAVLYQEQDHRRVIAYASRGLTSSESRYPAHKLEFLALKWAVTDKFRDYLYGQNFQVFTDNNPLTYVLTTAKLDATGHRWLSELSAYNFEVKYRSGQVNKDADALSRKHESEEERDVVLPGHVVSSICMSQTVPMIETLLVNPGDVPIPSSSLFPIQSMSAAEWRDLQRSDTVLAEVIEHLEGKVSVSSNSPEVKKLLSEANKLIFQDGVLYRNKVDHDDTIMQLVLPSKFHQQALRGVHDDVGHMGKERTLDLLQRRFYWVGMLRDVSLHLKNCDRCIRRKTKEQVSPLVSITTSQPLELLCIDYLSLEQSKGGVTNVLVITDHFTRYSMAIPTHNQTAKTTANILFKQFICHYGFPRKLHSDQGRNFESRIIKELCKLAQIDKTHTTPYHPMGNGQVERFNRTLLNMLGTLSPVQKANWKEEIGPIVHAYNCTRNSSTGYSPFYLMYGREPKLAVDIALGVQENIANDKVEYSTYVKHLKDRLTRAYDLAYAYSGKQKNQQKAGYDSRKRLTKATLQTGDRVLVKLVGWKGPHKLANKWSDEVFQVVSQAEGGIPVYKVCGEQTGLVKTLHRNMLLPIGDLSLDSDTLTQPKTQTTKRNQPEHDIAHNSNDDSDSEPELMYYPDQQKLNVVEHYTDGDDTIDQNSHVDHGSSHDDSQLASPDSTDVSLDGSSIPDSSVTSSTKTSDGSLGESIGSSVQSSGSVSQSPVDVIPRRSTRERRPPAWFASGDYVTTQPTKVFEIFL